MTDVERGCRDLGKPANPINKELVGRLPVKEVEAMTAAVQAAIKPRSSRDQAGIRIHLDHAIRIHLDHAIRIHLDRTIRIHLDRTIRIHLDRTIRIHLDRTIRTT